jgi:hypothetical protein
MRNLLLFMVYLFLFTPVSLVSRIVRDPLCRCLDRGGSTYWIFTSYPRTEI